MRRRLSLVVVLAACGTPSPGTSPTGPGSDGHVHVAASFGGSVPPGVRTAITARLTQLAPDFTVVDPDAPVDADLLLTFGDTPAAQALIPAAELAALGPEGFIARSGAGAGGGTVIAAAGNALADGATVNVGDGYAGYAVLEALGCSFHHPLAPTIPNALPATLPTLNISESPRWHIRGFHIHSQHPTELANMLSGWGPDGYDDRAAFEAQLPQWDLTLEWLIANRQNRVEWMPLWAQEWAEFADSAERIVRLKELVDHAHGFAIDAGVDVPITLAQQHAYRLIRTDGDLNAQIAELDSRVDYLMGAGFDFLATENGTSEFTHSDDNSMLAWMNELAIHLDTVYHKVAFTKIHVSQGQLAPDFHDAAGNPLNINLLPQFADPRLGVYPHTVEEYALDDPAPTYGNTTFAYQRTFMQEQAGIRPTVWNPETAYWVSVDIDLPLFLPVYAQRRVRDLRLIAGDEDAGLVGRGAHAGAHIDGQMVFSSGWEWAYWLNDVVAARAAWNPHTEAADDDTALRAILADVLANDGASAAPTIDAIVATADTELAQLINGLPGNVVRRNGQAYLQGFDTWDDVADLVDEVTGTDAVTQPDRLGMIDMRNPLHAPPAYTGELDGLLASMQTELDARATTFEGLAATATGPAAPELAELADAARVTALRARQVAYLYAYADEWANPFDGDGKAANIAAARQALDDAGVVIRRREAAYRVPLATIASWSPGPTAYQYRYLWSVHSQWYWYRDEGKATQAPISPCYMNIVDPVDVAGLGEGLAVDVVGFLNQYGPGLGLGSIAECTAAPAAEPVTPPPGLR